LFVAEHFLQGLLVINKYDGKHPISTDSGGIWYIRRSLLQIFKTEASSFTFIVYEKRALVKIQYRLGLVEQNLLITIFSMCEERM
jgi:hypothetical protein